ncbi:LysM peptidoglycan-binding domain-containing protein [Pseudoxanthomonas winnipegensis]|uniref:LysM peptidoglycan-binding domain-containing protein n=2 Tax=Pseudoxanthomonas winnipegensis TaxID=2480810 RepID=A0A4Q8L9S8_9GAMM|nr:LysM peptidoglycan-binding domain-containing protein [Pseudoxanthomonas winnipegensis]TAA25001.1 LysM peptidoglycan-binding domain-containing protein [Pseudoxanthomonas winnipegensis]TAA38011.1 LysM peptidoglycan-binding domain-containing protein [Pseudoxanthomonas winnipegensis]
MRFGMDLGLGPTRRVAPLALLMGTALALAACSSTVTRTSGPASRPGVGGGTSAPRAVVSKPQYGKSVTVQRGQTLYRIATDNGIAPADLAAWNGLSAPYTIYPGQSLRLFPSNGARPGTTVATGRPATSAPAGATPTPVAAPPPVKSDIAWRWPADGQIVGRFVPGDASNQGVDIAGNAGDAVRATADGVVVYSGAGLVGYGELIIVKHSEAWLSAYGHNRKRLVNEGQRVKSGQQIAEMGRSGASRDMLHFEIRYNGKPVDPLVYLPPK